MSEKGISQAHKHIHTHIHMLLPTLVIPRMREANEVFFGFGSYFTIILLYYIGQCSPFSTNVYFAVVSC